MQGCGITGTLPPAWASVYPIASGAYIHRYPVHIDLSFNLLEGKLPDGYLDPWLRCYVSVLVLSSNNLSVDLSRQDLSTVCTYEVWGVECRSRGDTEVWVCRKGEEYEKKTQDYFIQQRRSMLTVTRPEMIVRFTLSVSHHRRPPAPAHSFLQSIEAQKHLQIMWQGGQVLQIGLPCPPVAW